MMSTSYGTGLLIALSMLKGVGPSTLRKITNFSGFPYVSIDELATQFPPIARALDDPSAWSRGLECASIQLDEADKFNARILSPLDEDYPKLLAATKDDPFLIYVRGRLSPLPEKSIAIIGTREPTLHGQKIGMKMTRHYAEEGWSIVSGLAMGCDGIAHQSALDARGHTVAVLAHGLQMIAPARHRALADAILGGGGALVSQYPFGQLVQRQQYVQRDRVQAGMAQAVVMIQSDVQGGSLHASRAAIDYDRWLIVPYPTEIDVQNCEGKIQANLLLADGTDSERASLLRCSPIALRRVRIVRNKSDYFSPIDRLAPQHELSRQSEPNLSLI